MTLAFGTPLALLLLLLIPVALWAARGKLRAFSGRQRFAAFALRAGLFAALVITLADPRYGRPDDHLAVVMAVDTSSSVQPPQQALQVEWVRQARALARPDDQLSVVEFGRWASPVDQRLGGNTPPGDATNLADALDLGASLLPADGRRRVILLTDGEQNVGRAQESVAELAARGIDWSGVERAQGESFRWKGKYSYDLQSRETLETRLGVFAHFQPKIPAAFRAAEYVFLGNIDPELQLGVLGQVKRPKLVVCDTMNYWIQGKREPLLELLGRVDVLMVNDSEARELSGDWNIHRAGRWILGRGPSRVVIKQGEYGALLIEPTRTFYVPAFPLESVFDPTGAGDAFAGGFMAYLARTGSVSEDNIRRAMVYGAAMGSYAVEQFGVRAFERITLSDVGARVRAFQDLTHVMLAEALP